MSGRLTQYSLRSFANPTTFYRSFAVRFHDELHGDGYRPFCCCVFPVVSDHERKIIVFCHRRDVGIISRLLLRVLLESYEHINTTWLHSLLR